MRFLTLFIYPILFLLGCNVGITSTAGNENNQENKITVEYVQSLIDKLKSIAVKIKNAQEKNDNNEINKINEDIKNTIIDCVDVQKIIQMIAKQEHVDVQEDKIIECIVNILHSGILDFLCNKESDIKCENIKEGTALFKVFAVIYGHDVCKSCEIRITKTNNKINNISFTGTGGTALISLLDVIKSQVTNK